MTKTVPFKDYTVIAVDFDGTLAKHAYPGIGEEVPHAFTTLLDLMSNQCRLVLHTMRHGPELKSALDFCAQRGVVFWGVNQNHDQKTWTNSPKIYAQHYIDDAAIGCPLVEPHEPGERPYADWAIIRDLLEKRGLLE